MRVFLQMLFFPLPFFKTKMVPESFLVMSEKQLVGVAPITVTLFL